MSSRKLVYNFLHNKLTVVSNDVKINKYHETAIPIPEQEEFHVMLVHGVCDSDNTFVLTTPDDFYTTYQNYLASFTADDDEEEITTKKSTHYCDDFILVKELQHSCEDLNVFSLLQVTRKRE